MKVSRKGTCGLAGAVAVISTLTALQQVGLVPLRLLAASPHAVGAGRLWLVVTNALVTDDPIVVSLLAFVLLGVAALAICGPRLTLAAAALGHVGATVVVYLAVALVRGVDPRALDELLDHRDYGVSAILAAWIGAGAAVLWRTRPDRRSRMGIVAFCGAVAALGWSFDTKRTYLDADHVVAFAIGIALVVQPVWSLALAPVRTRAGTRRQRPARSTIP